MAVYQLALKLNKLPSEIRQMEVADFNRMILLIDATAEMDKVH